MSPFCFTNASCQQMLCGRCSPFRRLQQHKIKTELTRAANEQEAGYVLLLLLSGVHFPSCFNRPKQV